MATAGYSSDGLVGLEPVPGAFSDGWNVFQGTNGYSAVAIESTVPSASGSRSGMDSCDETHGNMRSTLDACTGGGSGQAPSAVTQSGPLRVT